MASGRTRSLRENPNTKSTSQEAITVCSRWVRAKRSRNSAEFDGRPNIALKRVLRKPVTMPVNNCRTGRSSVLAFATRITGHPPVYCNGLLTNRKENTPICQESGAKAQSTNIRPSRSVQTVAAASAHAFHSSQDAAFRYMPTCTQHIVMINHLYR